VVVKPVESGLQRLQIAPVQTDPVDGDGRHRDDDHLRRGDKDARIERLPGFTAEDLRVGQTSEHTGQRSTVVEADRRDHQGARQTPSPGLVDPCDDPRSTLKQSEPAAIEAERITKRLVRASAQSAVTCTCAFYNQPIFPGGQ